MDIQVKDPCPPIPLLNIEISFELIENRRLDLEHLYACCFGVGLHNVDNQPFLTLLLRYTRMPILDLFLNGAFVCFRILRIPSTNEIEVSGT